MIIGIGTDIIAIHRIESLLNRQGESFPNKIFTPTERTFAATLSPMRQVAFYAKRFAAKEAVAKALGTGIGAAAHWQDIEILSAPNGAPTVQLSGTAAQTLRALAHQYMQTSSVQSASDDQPDIRIHLSLADDTFAQAFVIIEIV